MKEFLAKFALFISLICSISIGIIIISDLAVKSREQKNLKISDDIDMVFAGDSNVECAVNDSLIANSINIAQSGEAYLYSYVKIKSLLEHNSQINTVFLGLSENNLLKEIELRWLFSDEFVIEKIGLYSYLMDHEEKLLIAKNNPKAYWKGLLESVRKNIKLLRKSFSREEASDRIENFGGFEYLVRDKLNEGMQMVSTEEQYVELERGHIQEKYLRMISDLCFMKSVNLIFINTPKHNYYIKHINQKARQDWLSFIDSLPRDSLIDLSGFALSDSCYGDLQHVNYKGAKIFSEYLNRNLKAY